MGPRRVRGAEPSLTMLWDKDLLMSCAYVDLSSTHDAINLYVVSMHVVLHMMPFANASNVTSTACCQTPHTSSSSPIISQLL